ncbi:MAG: glucose-1-phosphate adenylyltransferase [Acidobacteriota bacterium]|nr:glucose-1-phosphate adenylyltransferase [Acidobacteriota bacterium]
MKRPKILALILAGGVGGRLGVLTENRAKPVMPFGGFYRLIDFALSNCLHSQISDVWVIEQYELHSLNEHLSNGRPWDLDRTYGGLLVLPPNQNRDDEQETESGFAEGNADAIYRHRSFIRSFNPDILIVLSADHIYKLDFRDVVEQHLAKGADVTMVTTKVPENESATRFGAVKTDENGRVIDFAYKPEHPESDLITTEVFVYNAARLLDVLDELANPANAANSLKDFGHELVPKLVGEGKAFEFRFNDYWLDVGTVDAYWRGNMDLLDKPAELNLDDPDWAILTLAAQRVPAFIDASAEVKNSLIANGAKICGRVEHSILSPGVIIEEGATVRDSVILHDAVIEKDAEVFRAIVNNETRITAGSKIGNEQEITVVGKNGN